MALGAVGLLMGEIPPFMQQACVECLLCTRCPVGRLYERSWGVGGWGSGVGNGQDKAGEVRTHIRQDFLA